MFGRAFIIYLCCFVLIFGVSNLSGVSGAKSCHVCGGQESCKNPKEQECPTPDSICTNTKIDGKAQVKMCLPKTPGVEETCKDTSTSKGTVTVCVCSADLCNAGFLMKPMSWIYLSWMGLSIAALGSGFIGMPM